MTSGFWDSQRVPPDSLNSSSLRHLLSTNVNPPIPPDRSLSAIVPVTNSSLSALNSTLADLLGVSDSLVEVVLLAPRSLNAPLRRALHRVLSDNEHLESELSIDHWPDGLSLDAAVLAAGRRATTDWVLLMDDLALSEVSPSTREHLLLQDVPFTHIPYGPHGMDLHTEKLCIQPSSTPQNASYLVPPLVIPTELLTKSSHKHKVESWHALGTHISRSGESSTGGLVVGSTHSSSHWCERYTSMKNTTQDTSTLGHARDPSEPLSENTGSFVFVVDNRAAKYLQSIACSLASRGHDVVLVVTSEVSALSVFYTYPRHCQSAITVIDISSENPSSASSAQLGLLGAVNVIVSAVEDPDVSYFSWYSISSDIDLSNATYVHIPHEDLPYCDWMATLDLNEWMNWSVPRVELSIITDSRPESLRRLLLSLETGRFFGDSVTLRINMEQSADFDTQEIVNNYQWPYGNVFVHHRVQHGGLMAAVVESWYPRDNDTYGLMLEDDVELSPLFYAWVKMTLLRYRYGKASDRSPRLFGISLYQQKAIELHPDGRKAFSARHTLEHAGFSHPDAPYLSQIPCSWGALYFPEHWREFHTYLAARLAGHLPDSPPPPPSSLPAAPFPPSVPVVPDVRSNGWKRSWKRYFIELAYLRGYAMLYPNYAGARSLSTNHLEAGAHVSLAVPPRALERKKKLFNVPLLPLPGFPKGGGGTPSTGLLEMPGATLPEWTDLPILDLLGESVDAETIVRRGSERRTELTGCADPTTDPFSVRDLLCVR
ncbi:uncharacterized protein BXZ73DRAFT_45178 [Epithele typhae]|uniref:uncharacterized protein n=1 Tax=Epithele typhae TaxID=378194 RepID=UPI002008AA2C|nr:uncharacterized protein BXZ73DRAFT_45178 [Epithele typhae]KAH9935956.1 hypothetical protein BXZ73DRAFT_45178 [Epithele typhae]